ncbi:MAG: lysophospholipid acyltransferase family protein, partial [Myxococcota bacterium]
IGAFGVDLDEPRDGGVAIRYAARLLKTPRTLVWVFPQGDERPITERPLGFQQGAAAIARLSPNAIVLPMALRYEFGNRERPVLHINVGEPLPHFRDVENGRAAQEQAVTGLLDELDEHIRGGQPAATNEVFYQHSPSAVSRWMEMWLVRFTRGNTPRET